MEELARPNHGAAAPHAQMERPAPRRLPQEAHDGLHEAKQTSEEEAGADQALIEDVYLRAELESHFGIDHGMEAASPTSTKRAGKKPDEKQATKQKPAAKRAAQIKKPKPETKGKQDAKAAPRRAAKETKAAKAGTAAALTKEADTPPPRRVK